MYMYALSLPAIGSKYDRIIITIIIMIVKLMTWSE